MGGDHDESRSRYMLLHYKIKKQKEMQYSTTMKEAELVKILPAVHNNKK